MQRLLRDRRAAEDQQSPDEGPVCTNKRDSADEMATQLSGQEDPISYRNSDIWAEELISIPRPSPPLKIILAVVFVVADACRP